MPSDKHDIDYDTVLFIGIPITALRVTNEKLFNLRNLRQFSTFVWDPKSIVDEIKIFWKKEYDGSWNSTELYQMEKTYKEALNDIFSLVKSGASLIVISRCLPTLYPTSQYSSGMFDLNSLPVLNIAQAERLLGDRIEPCGPSEIRDTFKELCGTLQYQAVLHGKNIEPLLEARSLVDNKHEVVGGVFRPDGGLGLILFAPPPINWNNDDEIGNAIRTEYVQTLLNISNLLKQKRSTLPKWADDYWISGEIPLRERKIELQDEISTRQSELETLRLEIEKYSEIKGVFTSTGDALVQLVRHLLTNLSVSNIDGPKHHADALAVYGNVLGVLEIKGFDGAAKRWSITQCENWVNEVVLSLSLPENERQPIHEKYLEVISSLGINTENPDEISKIRPKGVLVVNTFRHNLLDERVSEIFPNDLETQIKHKGICAVSSLQILCMYLDVRAGGEKRQAIIDDFFSTEGIYRKYRNWSDYISSSQHR